MTESTIDVINRLGPIAEDTDRLARLIDLPFPLWANQCHGVSLALLRTGEFGPGRIARGTCKYIVGQHSWIVLGPDCYDENATIVDPTLWAHDGNSARNLHRPEPAVAAAARRRFLLQRGPAQQPRWPEIIELTPVTPLKPSAQSLAEHSGSA